MTAQQNKGLSIALTFLWIGFVCAISFMEAWLKFQAPEVTLSIGLGIGRLVFQTLNKIEWVFAIGIIITLPLSTVASTVETLRRLDQQGKIKLLDG